MQLLGQALCATAGAGVGLFCEKLGFSILRTGRDCQKKTWQPRMNLLLHSRSVRKTPSVESGWGWTRMCRQFSPLLFSSGCPGAQLRLDVGREGGEHGARAPAPHPFAPLRAARPVVEVAAPRACNWPQDILVLIFYLQFGNPLFKNINIILKIATIGI
jgi:hypothetical protein